MNIEWLFTYPSHWLIPAAAGILLGIFGEIAGVLARRQETRRHEPRRHFPAWPAVDPHLSLWYGTWSGGNNSVVECDLAKVEVAGSNPVSRSNLRSRARASVGKPREGCPP